MTRLTIAEARQKLSAGAEELKDHYNEPCEIVAFKQLVLPDKANNQFGSFYYEVYRLNEDGERAPEKTRWRASADSLENFNHQVVVPTIKAGDSLSVIFNERESKNKDKEGNSFKYPEPKDWTPGGNPVSS